MEAQQQQAQAQQQLDLKKHEDDIAVKREKIHADMAIAAMREQNNNYRTETGLIDSDNNGIADELDLRRTEVDEEYKNNQIDLKQAQLEEVQRSNRAKEELKRRVRNQSFRG